jgi:hypothetical protein
MRKIFIFICTLTIMALACDLSVTVAPTTGPASTSTNTVVTSTLAPTQVPDSATPTPEVFIALTQAIPNATATSAPTSSAGTAVTYSPLSLVIPSAVANEASGSDFSRVDGDDAAWWQKTPGHLQVMLGDYYVLQGKSNQPQIYVYPALEYAQLVPAAFESIHRLDNILYDPNAPISADQLPMVPFFNARQVFASNVQVISFQNGRGVRFLTEYAQSPASVNNTDLFYQFQGVTNDGAYYVVAILPITAPTLAETNDSGAAHPHGGIPYPYFADPNADMNNYYAAVTALLNTTPPETFFPTIDQLDSLVQSMQITP